MFQGDERALEDTIPEGVIELGGRVQVRDGANLVWEEAEVGAEQHWREATVTSLEPLLIQPDGFQRGYRWDEVKLADGQVLRNPHSEHPRCQESMEPLNVGDQVEVRDNVNAAQVAAGVCNPLERAQPYKKQEMKWLPGIVTQLTPFRVHPEGFARSHSWDCVRLVRKAPPQPRRSQSAPEPRLRKLSVCVEEATAGRTLIPSFGKNATHGPIHMLIRMGKLVQVQDAPWLKAQDEAWATGAITCLNPLKVQPEGFARGYTWEKVKLPNGDVLDDPYAIPGVDIDGSFLQLGDRVWCWDDGDERIKGTVTKLLPLMVRPDRFVRPWIFEQVLLLTPEEIGAASLFGGLAKLEPVVPERDSCYLEKSEVFEFTAQLDHSAGDAYGIEHGDEEGDDRHLEILGVDADGLVERWNVGHPGKRLRAGDRILECNGKRGGKAIDAAMDEEAVVHVRVEARRHFEVMLDHTDAGCFYGVEIEHWAGEEAAHIRSLDSDGLFASWNAEERNCKVYAGDCIVEVNGHRDGEHIDLEMDRAAPMRIIIERRPAKASQRRFSSRLSTQDAAQALMLHSDTMRPEDARLAGKEQSWHVGGKSSVARVTEGSIDDSCSDFPTHWGLSTRPSEQSEHENPDNEVPIENPHPQEHGMAHTVTFADSDEVEAPGVLWEMRLGQDWVLAPFRPPEKASAGMQAQFVFEGLLARVEFSGASDGVVRCKDREYPCRAKREQASLARTRAVSSVPARWEMMTTSGAWIEAPFKSPLSDPTGSTRAFAFEGKSGTVTFRSDGEATVRCGEREYAARAKGPDWEMQLSSGAWLPAPFKPPSGEVAGKHCSFEFKGVNASVHFTSATDGVVICRDKHYICRAQKAPAAAAAPRSAPLSVRPRTLDEAFVKRRSVMGVEAVNESPVAGSAQRDSLPLTGII